MPKSLDYTTYLNPLCNVQSPFFVNSNFCCKAKVNHLYLWSFQWYAHSPHLQCHTIVTQTWFHAQKTIFHQVQGISIYLLIKLKQVNKGVLVRNTLLPKTIGLPTFKFSRPKNRLVRALILTDINRLLTNIFYFRISMIKSGFTMHRGGIHKISALCIAAANLIRFMCLDQTCFLFNFQTTNFIQKDLKVATLKPNSGPI